LGLAGRPLHDGWPALIGTTANARLPLAIAAWQGTQLLVAPRRQQAATALWRLTHDNGAAADQAVHASPSAAMKLQDNRQRSVAA